MRRSIADTGESKLCEPVSGDIGTLVKADIKEMAGILAILALMCAICFITGIGCPIKFLTGISCPGCGISRALLSLALGDIRAAFHYHPLFWFPILLVVLWFFRRSFDSRQIRYFLTAAVAMYLVVYVIRMYGGGDIVVFRPKDGMIIKIITGLADGISRLWH